MQQSGYPAKIPLPWANAVSTAYKNAIPTPSQGGTNPALASFTDGFPAGTFGAAGSAPYGQDFNGILYQISAGLQYVQAGSVPVYDATFSTDIGGYPKGALLASTSLGSFWVNSLDGNTTNPDSGGSNWLNLFAGLAPLASPAFSGVPTAPTPGVGSNTTQIANTAWTSSNFAPTAGNASQTFSVAAGSGSDAVPYSQMFQALVPTASQSITPVALLTVVTPSLSAAGTFTIQPGSFVGQEVVVYSCGFPVTVESNVTSGAPYFQYPDNSANYSFTLPAQYGQTIKLVWDDNWFFSTTGRTIVAPAVAPNQAVPLGQADALYQPVGSYQVALGYTPAHAGANTDITSLAALTTPLSVAQGGSGVATSTGTGSLVLSVSPTFTGAPLAPTAPLGTNTTQLATTAFVLANSLPTTFGAVGTYVLASSVIQCNPGATVAGSNLSPTSVVDYTTGSTLSGTWRAMGYSDGSGNSLNNSSYTLNAVTVFLRIA